MRNTEGSISKIVWSKKRLLFYSGLHVEPEFGVQLDIKAKFFLSLLHVRCLSEQSSLGNNYLTCHLSLWPAQMLFNHHTDIPHLFGRSEHSHWVRPEKYMQECAVLHSQLTCTKLESYCPEPNSVRKYENMTFTRYTNPVAASIYQSFLPCFAQMRSL